MRKLVCSAVMLFAAAFAFQGAYPADPAGGETAGPEPPLVERFGDLSRAETVGAAAFSSQEILDGLRGTPGLFMATHPRAPLATLVAYLESSSAAGYLEAGFPAAKVVARPDTARGIMTITIEEGRWMTAVCTWIYSRAMGRRSASARSIARPGASGAPSS